MPSSASNDSGSRGGLARLRWWLALASLASIFLATVSEPSQLPLVGDNAARHVRSVDSIPVFGNCTWPDHHETHCGFVYCKAKATKEKIIAQRPVQCVEAFELVPSSKDKVYLMKDANCPNATPPGKPRFSKTGSDSLHIPTIKPVVNGASFTVEVSWYDPQNAINLVGYQVDILIARRPISTYTIPKSVTQYKQDAEHNRIVLTVDKALCPDDGVECFLPSAFRMKTFINADHTNYYFLKIMSLPVESWEKQEHQMVIIKLKVPSCADMECPQAKYNVSTEMDCVKETLGWSDLPNIERPLCTCEEKRPTPTENPTPTEVGSGSTPATNSELPSTTTVTGTEDSDLTQVPSGIPGVLSANVIVASCVAGSVVFLVVVFILVLFVLEDRKMYPRSLFSCLIPKIGKLDSKHTTPVGSISTACEDLPPEPVSTTPAPTLQEQVKFAKSLPNVYISYSRFDNTIRLQAQQLYAALSKIRVAHVTLDTVEENEIAPDHPSWFQEKIQAADRVIVLLDTKHPLHPNTALIEGARSVDSHGLYQRAILETDILLGKHYDGFGHFIIPVFIGAADTSCQTVIPPMLREKTLVRLSKDFTINDPEFLKLITLLGSHEPIEQSQYEV